ncbi:MAG TPA: SDR family NAD(P)-dependent oxidoreductase [Myxococcota bacterium]|jgi:NAD(P)-dependent dehydrogenase (short-subunit alcohol dehydrogenase family)
MARLEGRVAIVTGGGSGIGRATVLAFAREGAAVVVADIAHERAERVAHEVAAAGGRAHAQAVDVADESSVAAMVAAAVAHFGGLDVLHNNAAATDWSILGGDGEIAQLDLAIWERSLAVNLRGPFLGCKHAIPAMLKRGRGSIVNTSSASGSTGDLVRTAYGVSKAGVDGLTRYVATQYGKRGIRCNAIAPGVIETPALRQNVPAEQVALFERHHLTPRLGTPEDIAAAVVFLASDDAAFITGQIICVDGGLLAHHPTVAEVRSLGERA